MAAARRWRARGVPERDRAPDAGADWLLRFLAVELPYASTVGGIRGTQAMHASIRGMAIPVR
jgi:hypothetical protein